MLIALCLVPIVLLVAVAAVISCLISGKKIKQIPHPPFLPIIGNGNLFINNPPSEIPQVIRRLIKDHGKRFQIALGLDLVFFTSDVKDFEV